jgi:hypothetical protein
LFLLELFELQHPLLRFVLIGRRQRRRRLQCRLRLLGRQRGALLRSRPLLVNPLLRLESLRLRPPVPPTLTTHITS